MFSQTLSFDGLLFSDYPEYGETTTYSPDLQEFNDNQDDYYFNEFVGTENGSATSSNRSHLLPNEDQRINEIPVEEVSGPGEEPHFFQAFEFVDIVKKMEKVSSKEKVNEEKGTKAEHEPSNEIMNCISEFLGCIQGHPDFPESDEMAAKARNCYQLFQDCSGSVILIPDLYRN